ncbi:hypothetical protein VPH35_016308 [Triticum aestivum]
MQDRSELHYLRCSLSPDQIFLLRSGTSPAWLRRCSGDSDPTRRRCSSTGTLSMGSLPPHLILSPSHERCSFTATLTPSRSSCTPARLQHHQLDLDAGRGDAQPWASSTSASAFVAWPRVS